VRILVIEDEKKLADFIRRALREDGHAVDVRYDGVEGGHLALVEEYDAIVLDLLLPGRDGMSILKELRAQKKPVRVLILTAQDSVQARIRGLDEGADDYLPKPFSLEELRARVRALLRRGDGSTATSLEFTDLSMDLLGRRVRRQGREIVLTQKEFSLLEYFLRNPRKVLTRTAIAEHVWDFNFEWQSNIVDVFVKTLRQKLEESGETRVIQTIRGVGYVLRETESAVR
jgi:DNA-binding response OmpR family regulator